MKRPELLYYSLADGVTAFTTTRNGGMSQGVYGEMNINPFCGDDEVQVEMNRCLLAKELGISEQLIFLPQQVHETDCFWVEPMFLKLSAGEQHRQLAGVDALVTQLQGICIGISTADCIPIILYDPRLRVAAVVHAGWRGTARRIVQRVIDGMKSTFGTITTDLLAQIGPGISMKNFEVGDEVYEDFEVDGFNMEQISRRFPSADGGERWHIDLPRCNYLQLKEAGLIDYNIKSCGVCTYDHADNYFSARRLGADCGRLFTGIIIR